MKIQAHDETEATDLSNSTISAGSKTSQSHTLRNRFWSAVQACLDFLNSNEIDPNPVHAEFPILIGGWNWNRIKQPGGNPDYKVQVFFNSGDLALLNNCPFHCKFAPNTDPTKDFTYCGFAYPGKARDMERLEAWASRFPEAAVFTYGSHTPNGWIQGEFVKSLSSCDKEDNK